MMRSRFSGVGTISQGCCCVSMAPPARQIIVTPSWIFAASAGHRLIVTGGSRQVRQKGFAATRNSIGRVSKSLPRQTNPKSRDGPSNYGVIGAPLRPTTPTKSIFPCRCEFKGPSLELNYAVNTEARRHRGKPLCLCGYHTRLY